MKIVCFMGAILILFVPPSVSAKITPIELTPPNLFSGEEQERDPQEIITGIKWKIANDPENYENYGILAFAYDYVGDYANELEALKMEVRYMPDDLEEKDVIYGNLARAYMLNDQWEQGKGWLDKADAINFNNFYNR